VKSFDENAIEKLRERYPNLHPLIFHRSIERAKSMVELFDILETVPKNFPIVWCEKNNRWKEEKDLFLIDEEFFEDS
jgi:hypothetical protein